MKPVSEIRLINLESLVAEAGTADALAERSGVSPVYVSQIRSRAIDRKTGKARNLGSAAARKLEKGMGKEEGWMDRDHSGSPTPTYPNGWPFERIQRSDFDRLSDSQKAAIEDWVYDQVQAFLASAPVKSKPGKSAA
ncbi:hypothetical protein CBF45_12670 [Bordetella sp. J329]|nr:hypothetical protein CBF45_12670 [Bordetella sp. J329]